MSQPSISKTSVIMVSYHTGSVLFMAIKAALRQKELGELILVDNGNPPDVLSRLQQMALSEPRLKIMTGHGNIGVVRGRNQGAREASCEHLLFVNPECLLPPDALSMLAQQFAVLGAPVLLGCVQQHPNGSVKDNTGFSLLTPKISFLSALGIQRFSNPYPLNSQEPFEVSAISGAFMAMRKSDYERIGGFDAAFFLHIADMDLCMRTRLLGGRILCVPQIKLVHLPIAAEKRSAVGMAWKKLRSQVYYLKKHFSNSLTSFFTLFLLQTLLTFRFVLDRLWSILFSKSQKKPNVDHSRAAKRLMLLASGLNLPESKDLYGKIVLVTGATSPLGLCVVRRLIASGAAVLAMSRGVAIPYQHEYLRWIRADLIDANFSLDDYVADIVVHCAPLWHLPSKINTLVDAEVKHVIAFGSTAIMSKAPSQNRYEKSLVEKWTLAEAEINRLCGDRGIGWNVLRPTLSYGTGLDMGISLIADFIRRFGRFLIYPPAFGRRQPVHCDDLASAVVQLLKTNTDGKLSNKTYNLSGAETLTFHETVEKCFALYEKRVHIIETTLLPFLLDVIGWFSNQKAVNGEIARRMNDDVVFFHEEAKRDFGYQPRAFLSGGKKDIEGF